MVDLQAQYARIRAEIDAAIARRGRERAVHPRRGLRALRAGVRRLLRRRPTPCGVANGTDALTLALGARRRAGRRGRHGRQHVHRHRRGHPAQRRAAGVRRRRPRSFTMDPARLEARASRRGRRPSCPSTSTAIPRTWTPIRDSPRATGIPVLEDAAQAHGAEIAGRRAGTLGHAACFSFYPARTWAPTATRALVVSNDARVRGPRAPARQPRRRREQVRQRRARHQQPPRHAAGGGPAREAAPPRRAGTRERARARRAPTREALAGRPGLVLPRSAQGARSAWHLYTIRAEDRDGAADAPKARRASPPPSTTRGRCTCSRRWPPPAAGRATCRSRSSSAREVLCLPLYPELPLETVDRIAGLIRSFREAAAVRG